MKSRLTIVFGLILLLSSSCALLKSDQTTRFRADLVELGMSEKKFIKEFGNPTMQNTYIEDGMVVNELMYMETIIFNYQERKVNSTFVFKDGKLVRREQGEDLQYLQQQQFEKYLETQKENEAK